MTRTKSKPRQSYKQANGAYDPKKCHTQFYHWLYNALIGRKLSGAEWAIIMYIIRNNIGYGGAPAIFRRDDVAKLTGYDPKTVSRAFSVFMKKNIIIPHESSKKAVQVNFNTVEWLD
ncbi:hypothetical protein GM415_08920 [Pseudodesulfovibrio cashew]|uniref:Bacteriophage lambda Replication protein O N-terminal domain-containing protein n=1 Tax=Pseudodesulfovibrio cashew TaxID=2678688 RepID=A0A6I6JIL6_9BACT|nr:replication protein [Pseudodesulfovibrio cashew]QGY40243.1 hypothetical protein GM415_08920 [Pseudodesulfovibrio cashew]